MGVMDRFEKGIERAVNGVFAKAFRSEVQPVEIASALKRALDDRAAVISKGRTLVPNAFVVELGVTDHERLAEYSDALGDELVTALREHADQQRYAFVGPVSVQFEEQDDLDTGIFRVRSATTKAPREPAAHQPQPHQRVQPAGDQHEPPPTRAVEPVSPPPPAPVVTQRPWLDIDGHAYPLLGSSTVLGRGEDADIMVDDPGVSRRHAEVRITSDGPSLVATLRDLGSTNGTFVDGERAGVLSLVEGSSITLGRTRATYRSGPR